MQVHREISGSPCPRHGDVSDKVGDAVAPGQDGEAQHQAGYLCKHAEKTQQPHQFRRHLPWGNGDASAMCTALRRQPVMGSPCKRRQLEPDRVETGWEYPSHQECASAGGQRTVSIHMQATAKPASATTTAPMGTPVPQSQSGGQSFPEPTPCVVYHAPAAAMPPMTAAEVRPATPAWK